MKRVQTCADIRDTPILAFSIARRFFVSLIFFFFASRSSYQNLQTTALSTRSTKNTNKFLPVFSVLCPNISLFFRKLVRGFIDNIKFLPCFLNDLIKSPLRLRVHYAHSINKKLQ